MRILVPLLLVTVASVHGQSPESASRSCIVIQELGATTPLVAEGECTTRLSPASTFKIPHALVALETGVVTTTSTEKWDGRKYERQQDWNKDHTVISSLRPSVLWFFQRIAPRIGRERMTGWLVKFDYGNKNVAGPIDQYWVNGELAISPVEQVAFLQKLFGGQLPVKREYVRAVADALRQKQGSVENSLGIHPLDGDWRAAELTARTGATSTASYRVSWLVGKLRASQRDYVFASAVWRDQGAVDTLDASRLAAKTFIAQRLLPR